MVKKVIYKQTGISLPHPKVEWICECGFKLCIIQGYNPDYNSDDYGKLIHPKGKCMKCKSNIIVN